MLKLQLVPLLALLPAFAAAGLPSLPVIPGLPEWLKPKLTSKAYQKAISINNLLVHSRALAKFAAIDGANTRSFGTVGYNASADYVEKLAKSYGYDVYRQHVVYPASTIHSTAFIVNGTSYEVEAFQYSGSTPTSGVTAPLTYIPNLGCTAADWAGSAGKIGLVQRGSCTFVDRGILARDAQVAALVLYNNVAGAPVASRLDTQFDLNPPAVSITQTDGQALVALLADHALNATVKVDITNEYRTSDNVVAQTKYGDKDKVVFIGAHLDSVPAGPGINDDGSGTGTAAELLKQLAGFKKSKNAVRFAWWTAEEVGLVGSHYYVEHLSQEERDKILVYINMDMVASPNYILGIYDADNSGGGNSGTEAPPGSPALEKLFQSHFDQIGLNHTAYAFTSGSDYRSFLDAGIVAGGVATGAGGIKTEREAALFGGQVGVAYDPCYHQACDTLDNLAHDAYEWIARAIADIIGKLAQDASPIENEQKRVARGLPLERGVKDEISNLGTDCNHHDEL